MTRASRIAWIVAFVMAVVVTASACHKKVPPPAPAAAPPPPPPVAAAPQPPPPPPPPAPPPRAPAVAAPAPLTEDEIFARKSLDQLNAEKPLGDVFFDLDKSDIRDDGRSVLQRDADWMKRYPSSVVAAEGHCDSRGSAEYNLALGSRRAAAVKDYLVSLGVPAGRVTVISKGKEQPVCAEENESCWQQNRRGHFIVTAK
jgi:peptidoglycan-associated lipoprotein